ncbi:hypothetical protein, partial [Burkholderia sp. BCCCDS18]|uniref:hypothetical protein n=1 Tax=Burkholderia sp. BCCCDS18 TaxID=3390245 RepID=UPI003D2F1D4D
MGMAGIHYFLSKQHYQLCPGASNNACRVQTDTKQRNAMHAALAPWTRDAGALRAMSRIAVAAAL